MDKKKKALLITAGIAAVLLAAALFLSRPQPLGELLHTDEIEPPIRAIFSLAATVSTENGETSGVCDSGQRGTGRMLSGLRVSPLPPPYIVGKPVSRCRRQSAVWQSCLSERYIPQIP